MDTQQEEILRRLRAFAEAFAEQKLSSYNDRISRTGAISTSPKEINDSVWGTIKLSPLEVVVADSPLVQRLRFIRQLGVVHWVYPGASHSRFEHSLGVLHQSQQLINAINQAPGAETEASPIDRQYAAIVRLCALVHDIGHGVLSHVSEHALARRIDLRLALQQFASKHSLEKIQLSELMAYQLVGSPALQKMLSIAFDALTTPIRLGASSADNARLVAELCQKAIVGQHINEEVPLLHEIITGPFDADKLDYYVRDAKHAGVPSTLDISRLLQKLATRRVPSRDMPEEMLSRLREERDTRALFGLKSSGAAILDELQLARVLLYSKIYRHKKVSAIESMVDALFEAIGSCPSVDLLKLVTLAYSLYDDQLLVSDAETVFRILEVADVPHGLKVFVGDTLARLRDRNLYVSALSLAPKYPEDPWENDLSQQRGLDRLAGDCKNEQVLGRLRRELAGQLRSIHQSVNDSIGGLDPETLDYCVVVTSKPAHGGGTEIDRALILQGNRFVRASQLANVNRTAWADAYDGGKPLAVVFAPRECAAAVYVAAERHLRTQYSVVLPESALHMSKQAPERINMLKRELDLTGWYSGVPFDIRPLPDRLLRQDVKVRVERIARKLGEIDEPLRDREPRRATSLEARIISWLAQFRDNVVIECALLALEQMKVLGRDETRAALMAFANEHPEFKDGTICPLGEFKDSGTVQAYLSRDIEGVFRQTKSIDDAIATGGKEPIILIDDFTATGSQALDILAHWFNELSLRQGTLGEARRHLSEDQRRSLRTRPLAFVFVAGWQSGIERIHQEMQRLGLDAIVFAHLKDDQIPFAFQGEPGREPSDALKAFEQKCMEIGRALLESAGKDLGSVRN